MTATTFPAEDLQILQQIVSEPRFRAITSPPKFAVPELAVLFGSYLVFAGSATAFVLGLIPYWLMLILSATAIFTVFTPLHDAGHGSASSDPRINDLIGNAAAMLLLPGVGTPLFRFFHLEHHRYTGEKGRDPDETWISAPWPLRLLAWTFLDVTWVVHYYRRTEPRPPEERRQVRHTIALVLGWHAAWLLSPWAWEFVVLWLIPQRVATTFLVYLFGYLQHPEGVEQRHAPFQATRMIRGGPVVRLLMLGQAQHLMHHLFPSVPFYRYHDAWMASRPWLGERALVWQWPFWKAAPAPEESRQAITARAITPTLRARVASVTAVAADVNAYELVPVGMPAFPSFAPGAHIDVDVGDGQLRQYSLCGDPARHDHYRIAVKREAQGRGGSAAIHAHFTPGRVCRISPPRNLFPLHEDQGRHILVAGGIGLTPLLAMALHLERRQKTCILHVCARNAAVLPFGHALAGPLYASRTHIHLDDGPAAQAFGPETLPLWRPGDQLHLCGPRGFMTQVIGWARDRHWPDAAIHSESFAPTQAHSPADRAFEVRLQRSGRRLQVPADRTLLDVLQADGQPVVASCTQGLCGACLVEVADGAVEHRDRFLSEAEKRDGCRMATCVSRAAGDRLTLRL